LRQFKKGGFHLAQETNAIIIPLVIKGVDKILPSNSYRLTINGEVDVTIGKEFDAAEYTRGERSQLMQQVRNEMLRILEQD